MSKTVSVRLEHKSASKAKIQRRHNERLGAQPKYIDASRSALNSVLISAPFESVLRDKCEALRSSDYRRAMKSDAAVLSDGIITFGTEAQTIISSLSIEEQNKYFLKMAQAAAEHANSELVSLVVHRDESAVHAHFGLLAVTKEGIPVSKFLKPKDMEKLQDLASEVFSDLGIERGERKSVRIARGDGADKIYHRGVKQLHEDLPREIEELEAARDEMDKLIGGIGLREAERLKKAMDTNAELEAEIERKKSLLSNLDSSVTDLEAKKKGLESRNSALEASISNFEDELEEKREKALEERIARQKRLKELEEHIEASQLKLDKNLTLIDGAEKKLESLLASADSIEEKVKKAEKNLSIYEKRAQDAQKELERAQKEIEDITKAMATVEPLESIQEPLSERVEIITEKGLIRDKTLIVDAVDASDVREYIKQVNARESKLHGNAMAEAFKKIKGLEKREKEVEWREGQLDTREEKLVKREKAIEQREAELGINKQKQKQQSIEL